MRLAVPLPHLRDCRPGCACHDNHDSRDDQRQRRRRRPRDVDKFGEHDQRCPYAFSLGRHDELQEGALRPTLKSNKFHVSNSTTREFRRVDDPLDHDRRKGDLTTYGLFDDGATVLDVGITHPRCCSSATSCCSST